MNVLSIPEEVSVATVSFDGMDVAPAGLVRRTLFPGASGKTREHYDPGA